MKKDDHRKRKSHKRLKKQKSTNDKRAFSPKSLNNDAIMIPEEPVVNEVNGSNEETKNSTLSQPRENIKFPSEHSNFDNNPTESLKSLKNSKPLGGGLMMKRGGKMTAISGLSRRKNKMNQVADSDIASVVN